MKPRIRAGRAALSYVLLLLARLGSLNALEQRGPSPAWAKWLGGKMPSADLMGDVASSLRLEPLRDLLEDAHSLFTDGPLLRLDDKHVRRACWEELGRFPISGLLGSIARAQGFRARDTTAGNREASQFFPTWPQWGEKVRVVRSLEETSVRRQKDREEETLVSEWFWVTGLPTFLRRHRDHRPRRSWTLGH